MRNGRPTQGLCVTCNNAPDCYYLALRGPALFCELFDGYAPLEERRPQGDRAVVVGTPFAVQTGAEQTPPLLGLCVNCENRAECVHPKPAGGVWHCEEYR